jgi:uncharacterized membrane protein
MSKYQSKREKIMGESISKSKKIKWEYILPVAALISVVVYFMLSNNVSTNSAIESGPTVFKKGVKYGATPIQMRTVKDVIINNDELSIPLSAVKDYKIIYYEYAKYGKTVPLMSFITASGKLVSAVSMCEPCNSNKFHIEGDKLVCNFCDTIWTLDGLYGIEGGCTNYPPDVIRSTIKGNRVYLSEQEIRNWKRRV